MYSGLEKSAGCPGQADCPAREVTFHSSFPNEQGIRQVICKLGQAKFESCLSKVKLEFNFFSSPG